MKYLKSSTLRADLPRHRYVNFLHFFMFDIPTTKSEYLSEYKRSYYDLNCHPASEQRVKDATTALHWLVEQGLLQVIE